MGISPSLYSACRSGHSAFMVGWQRFGECILEKGMKGIGKERLGCLEELQRQ